MWDGFDLFENEGVNFAFEFSGFRHRLSES
jgi:hypothetical protein